MADASLRLGVLGLGRMGLPVARSLVRAGFEVRGYDVAASRHDAAVDAGIPVASSAAELARTVDVLITVLPGAPEAADALLTDGLVDQLPPGATLLDLTSNDPVVLGNVDARARSRGVTVVSAPMAGGPSAVESRALRFFAGGTEGDVERVRTLLEALGGDDAVDHVGPGIGDGCTAKLLVNLLWFGQVVAVTEALLLGVSMGVPVAVLRRTLAGSAGGSVFIDEYLDRLLDGDYLASFGIDRCVEELDILVRMAHESTVPFELSSTVAKVHRDALARFGAIDGELLAAKLLEQKAGIELRS